MNIFFTSRAKTDISEIAHNISQDNPSAARKLISSFNDSIKNLVDFPLLGRVVPEYSEDSIRELIIGQYRIVYKFNEHKKEIYIITIHHSNRLLL